MIVNIKYTLLFLLYLCIFKYDWCWQDSLKLENLEACAGTQHKRTHFQQISGNEDPQFTSSCANRPLRGVLVASGLMRETSDAAILCTVFCQTRHACMAGVHLWSTGCPQQSIPRQNQVCIDVQTLLCMLWYYNELPVHVCVHIIITRTTST